MDDPKLNGYEEIDLEDIAEEFNLTQMEVMSQLGEGFLDSEVDITWWRGIYYTNNYGKMMAVFHENFGS